MGEVSLHTDSTGHELPAGLSWNNTLATLDEVSLLTAAKEAFRDMLAASPEDLKLRDRVQGYFEEARAALEEQGDSDGLEVLGQFEDIVPLDNAGS